MSEKINPCDPPCDLSDHEECAAALCPHGEWLHNHHDGCPACYLVDKISFEPDRARFTFDSDGYVITKYDFHVFEFGKPDRLVRGFVPAPEIRKLIEFIRTKL